MVGEFGKVPPRRGKRRLVRGLAALGFLACLFWVHVPASTAADYTNVVFSDGFESGNLSAWDGGTAFATGTFTVTNAASHSGSYGVKMSNSAGEYDVLQKTLASPLQDSQVSFWVNVAPGGGIQTLAAARDGSSSSTMWGLLYDGGTQALYFYPYSSSGSTEIYTGAGSVPANTWVQITIQYTATSAGRAQVSINGQTNAAWGVSGDYTRTADLQRVQLWDDSTATTEFDDVQIAAPPNSAPSAPTGVQGAAQDGAVALSWTAPVSDGGNAIMGYVITPYIGSAAQSAIDTGSAATTQTVTGLTNGTSYTFTVAAVNTTGTGPPSVPSTAVTPEPAAVPGAPSGVTGTPGDSAVTLSWTAPSSNGGSAISGYQITPYIGSTAQTPVISNSASTTAYVSGLTNGTAYTFTVAAINAVGTGPGSAASAAITPIAAQTSFTNVVFSDGFESGNVSAWDNGAASATGTVTVSGAAAHGGSFGAEMSNTSGEYDVLQKTFANPMPDSSIVFWAKVAPGGGMQTLAQARDATSSNTMWGLLYDGTTQGLYFYPYSSSRSTEIYTGANSVPVNTWFKVEIQYAATASGGAQLYVNGGTTAAWGVSGDYTRTSYLQRLQLWDDSTATTDFDDVQVSTPPVTAPEAPTGVTAQARNTGASLSWTAPSYNGGSAITGYQITPYADGTAQTPILTESTSTTADVTGLTNGTEYTFTVSAINAVGTGASSTASAGVTPEPPTTAGVPTGVTGSPDESAVNLSWSAPSSDGGSPITSYQITPYIGGVAQTPVIAGSAATSAYVSGLTDGTAYTFTVAAINAAGTGTASSPSAAITPVAPNTRYTNPVFQDGFESGNLNAWDNQAAFATGSAAVSGAAAHSGNYGLEMSNGASGEYDVLTKTFAASLPDSQVTIWVDVGSGGGVETLAEARDSSNQPAWGLLYDGGTHGLYFFPYRGSASTQLFTGPDSVPVNTWVKIQIQYTATTTGGAQLYVDGQTNSAWGVSGDYTRTANLQKLQLWDDSTATTDFDGVTVATPPPPGDTVPAAPTAVSGIPRDGAVNLSWTAPSNDGGTPITQYDITPYIGTTAQTPVLTGSANTSYTVRGLTNNAAYTFTVAAVNGVGTGPASTASASITPVAAALPSAPTGVQASARDGAVGLTWTAPASDGGGDISGYQVTPYIGSTAQTPILTKSTATSTIVNGLTNGVTYTFTVAAINPGGTGPASTASEAVTPAPASAPGAPTSVSGSPADTAVDLSWAAPTADGGSPITGYQITPYVGNTAQTAVLTHSTSTSYTVTGLTDGTAYSFTVAAINKVGTGSASAASAPVTPTAPNAIQAENALAGDPTWGDFSAPPLQDPSAIAGYGSQISINHGQSIDFYVTTTAASVQINIYRMGWYGGAGARLMENLGTFPGHNQPQALPDSTYGMVQENWTKTTTLNVPSSWVSGVYLARLMASNGYGAVILFVVRDDGGHEPFLFQASTNTYQAYNQYGGTSLYSNYQGDPNWSSPLHPHATKVSFDRPFLNGNGAGDFLRWEYQFVRWMEKNGYNVAYTTDTDTDSNAAADPITNHKAFLSVGHDEYWSKGMRENVQDAIAAGVNVAFFGANDSYWQVRYEPDTAGVSNRVLVGYKDEAEGADPGAGGPDPEFNVNNAILTTEWRDPLVNQPEDALMGAMFAGQTPSDNPEPYTVSNASNWVFDGTGWTNGTTIPGIVGYEYDQFFGGSGGDSSTPANTTVLSTSTFQDTDPSTGQPVTDTANSTIYTAPSGAKVFDAGTIEWSWGLDNFGGAGYVNAGIQQVTSNILNDFGGISTPPGG